MAEMMQGPDNRRTPAEVEHRRAAQITEADDILRELLSTCSFALETNKQIGKVRGLLAEWRLETE